MESVERPTSRPDTERALDATTEPLRAIPARILIYDIEITPILGWAYDMFDARVIHVERQPHIMCFAYKWYGEKSVKCVSQLDFPEHYAKDSWDDGAVVKRLWELMDEADIVVAHNAARFDNRVANERFLAHGLGPVSPYKTIDTLLVARRYFKNASNSLDNLCRKLGLGAKPNDTHSALWHSCVNGDEKAWRKMVRYCKQDVVLLDKLYTLLRPYMPNHPHTQVGGCPRCGSNNLQSRGYATSATARYQRFQCIDCGGWMRSRLAEKEGKPELVSA